MRDPDPRQHNGLISVGAYFHPYFVDWGIKKSYELNMDYLDSTPYGRPLYEVNGLEYIEENLNMPEMEDPDDSWREIRKKCPLYYLVEPSSPGFTVNIASPYLLISLVSLDCALEMAVLLRMAPKELGKRLDTIMSGRYECLRRCNECRAIPWFGEVRGHQISASWGISSHGVSTEARRAQGTSYDADIGWSTSAVIPARRKTAGLHAGDAAIAPEESVKRTWGIAAGHDIVDWPSAGDDLTLDGHGLSRDD
ncbi:hypothetical protein CHU98_g1301 [Xylaria longipes]|nr:hypothetical protein CHU98_g1301 [Xylaria longipes]